MQTNKPEPSYYLCSLTTRAARRMIAYYNRELAELGLTANQAMALGVLWREDNVSLGRFAEKAEVGKAAAATMISRLESMGLVTRSGHPEDGRLNRLRLTDRARRLAPKVWEKAKKLEEAVEEALGPEALRQFIESFEVLEKLDL